MMQPAIAKSAFTDADGRTLARVIRRHLTIDAEIERAAHGFVGKSGMGGLMKGRRHNRKMLADVNVE